MRVIAIDPKEYPIIEWRWKVTQLPSKGDLTRRSGDDCSARIFLTFETDLNRTSFLEKVFYRAARVLYGDYPFADGITYVWASRNPAGEVIPSPYTDRLKAFVVESGTAKLNTWVREERNFYEDYRKAFGEEPPRLYSIAVMTDTDNTGGAAEAYYGDIVFKKPPVYGTIKNDRGSVMQGRTSIFSVNVDTKGRLIRALGGFLLLALAVWMACSPRPWAPWRVALLISLTCGGLFMLIEATFGWCAVRACGLKIPF